MKGLLKRKELKSSLEKLLSNIMDDVEGIKAAQLSADTGQPFASVLPPTTDDMRFAAVTAALSSLSERAIDEMPIQSRFRIATAGTKEKKRGTDISHLHLSEYAFYKEPEKDVALEKETTVEKEVTAKKETKKKEQIEDKTKNWVSKLNQIQKEKESEKIESKEKKSKKSGSTNKDNSSATD